MGSTEAARRAGRKEANVAMKVTTPSASAKLRVIACELRFEFFPGHLWRLLVNEVVWQLAPFEL